MSFKPSLFASIYIISVFPWPAFFKTDHFLARDDIHGNILWLENLQNVNEKRSKKFGHFQEASVTEAKKVKAIKENGLLGEFSQNNNLRNALLHAVLFT